MKPSPFRYFDPGSIDECVALLGEHGEDAKLLAGGQSLVPLMNLRLAAPEVVIDLNRVAGLAGARVEHGQLAIGAMTRQRDIAHSGVVREACPMLAHAAGMIATPRSATAARSAAASCTATRRPSCRAIRRSAWSGTRSQARKARGDRSQQGRGDRRLHASARFAPGVDTTPLGEQRHDFWEEVWIASGSIH